LLELQIQAGRLVAPTLPGLIAFSVTAGDGATVESASGLITLQRNSPQATVVQAAVVGGGIPPLAAPFYTNLIPGDGDVDLGSPTGAPLVARSAADGAFTVPVTVNFGSATPQVGKHSCPVPCPAHRSSH